MTTTASDQAVWIPIAADATGKVIEDKVLDEFFADPVGTFTRLEEWPARLLVVRDSALPQLDSDDIERIPVRHKALDVLHEFNAQVVTAPDVEFAWRQTLAVATAANSTKAELPNGPTGGY